MSQDDTTELPTFHRPIGGTDPHPATVSELIGRIDAQVDTIWNAAEARGTLDGAQAFAESAHELVLLAQSLEGKALDRVGLLTSTAEAALSDDEGDVLDEIYGAAGEVHDVIESRRGGERR